MKKLIYIFFVLVILLSSSVILLYHLANTKGKDYILKLLKEKYSPEATLREFSLKFPLKFRLVDFSLEDVHFSLLEGNIVAIDIFTKKIVLGKVNIEGLKINVKRKKEGIIIKPFLNAKNNAENSSKEFILFATMNAKPTSTKEKIHLVIKNLNIKDGTIYYYDDTLNPPLELIFEDVRLVLKNFKYPDFSKFHFDLISSLRYKDFFMKDLVFFKGWMDWYAKDMDAELNINGYNYFAFASYYPPFWKPDNLQLKEAYLSLEALISSANNDMIIDTTLYLDKYSFVDDPEDPSKVKSLKTVIALFKKDEDAKPQINLPIKTKMDKLEIDFSYVLKEFQKRMKGSFLDTLTNILGKTPEFIGKGTGEIKKITIYPTIEAIKSIFDILGGLLIPKEEEKEENPKEEPQDNSIQNLR